MNKPQIELEAKATETPVQKKLSLKLKGIRLPEFNLKDKFHNFNNNRAQLLKAYLAAILLFTYIFWGADVLYDKNFLKGNIDSIDYFYFSVVTITTLGYGEMLPGTEMAKFMVAVLTLFGLYILGMFLTASGNHIHKKEREVQDAKVLKNRIKPVSNSINAYFYNAERRFRMGTDYESEEAWIKCHIELSRSITGQSESVLELFELSENSDVLKVMNAMTTFIKETRNRMVFFDLMINEPEEFSGADDPMVKDRIKSLSSIVYTLSKAIDNFLDRPRLLVQLNPVKRG